MHGRNGLQFGVFMYPQHIQNRLNFGHSLLIFLVLASILLSETGQIWGFQTLSGEVQSMIQQRHFRCSAEAFMNAGIQCCLVLNYNWFASLIEWAIICDVFSLILLCSYMFPDNISVSREYLFCLPYFHISNNI